MSALNRRGFLQRGLAATAVAAVGLPAIGQEKSAQSANEKLRVAVIGVRGRGQAHARAFADRKDCEVVCVCDADRTIGAAYAKALGKRTKREPKFVEDMRRIFDDRSIDVVSIATPNHWHSLAAIWAMQAGKDAYVEKPVSHNISEGRRMVQVARKCNRICQGGTQKRSLVANQEAARYIAAGKLGKIDLAHCYMYRPREPIGPSGSYPVPKSVNYDLWAGPAPMAPVTRREFHYDWHWFWNYGNGEIGNNSIHCVDTMRQLLGLYGLGRSVICYGGRLKFHDAAETANVQVVVHDYDDLTVIQEIRNFKSAPPKNGGSVFLRGSKGALYSTGSGNVVYNDQGKVVIKFTEAGAEEMGRVTVTKGKHRDDFGNLDDRHIANFLKAVRSRKREDQIAEIAEGHNSTALCHLGNISYRLGKPVAPAEIPQRLKSLKAGDYLVEHFEGMRKHLTDNDVDITSERLTLGPLLAIDSAAEKFVASAAADAMLTRDYRKPYVVPGPDAI